MPIAAIDDIELPSAPGPVTQDARERAGAADRAGAGGAGLALAARRLGAARVELHVPEHVAGGGERASFEQLRHRCVTQLPRTHESSNRHREPAAVRQGRRGLVPPARGGRRGARPHRPALRRRALAGVLRRARAAAPGAPARPRRRLQHRADRPHAGARWSRCWPPRRPTWCSSTATRTRRWRARWPPRRRGSRSRTWRRGCARSTARCPRSSTACWPTTPPTCCCAPPPRRPRTCAPRASRARSWSSAT